jgi:CheY-like chemotaxis protein
MRHAWDVPVRRSALEGRTILFAESEPAIAPGIRQNFQAAGATVLSSRGLAEALWLAEHPFLSAAVVDVRFGSDGTEEMCRHLQRSGIRYVLYAGNENVRDNARRSGVVVCGMAHAGTLMDSVVALFE